MCGGDDVLLSPFSAVNHVKEGSAFSCVDMTEKGLYYIPQVESLVASRLSPTQRITLPASGPAVPKQSQKSVSELVPVFTLSSVPFSRHGLLPKCNSSVRR